jgi:uncharacterized protein YjbJ (UPF0337 family)
MGWDEIERSWNELKGEVKRQWSKLNDEDVELIKGKYAGLLGLLQELWLGSPDGLADASPILAQILSASVQSRVALGRRAGTRVGRLGAMPPDLAAAARGLRHAHLDGFDLHANVRVPPNDGARLEHLCRYLLRPPLVQDRLRNIIDSLSTRNFNYISVRSFILDGAPPKSIMSLIWFGGVRNLANMAAI